MSKSSYLPMFLLFLCGCPPDLPDRDPRPSPRFVESVATPEMVADLHRREDAYFNRTTQNPIKGDDDIVPLVWEELSSPYEGVSVHRTETTTGWLVLVDGDPVFIPDGDHTWRTAR